MNFNRFTVAVALAGVAGLAVLTGPSIFTGVVIGVCLLFAMVLSLLVPL